MKKSTRSDTTQHATGGFKPHGYMQLEQSGKLNVLEATGPFNKELVIAADAAQEALYAELVKKGRWGTILIFRENALTSLDAVEEITHILKKRAAQGYAPVAVALVFGAGVEGGDLMRPYYLNAYANAGIVGRCFSDELAAKEWVSDVINQTD